MNITKENIVMFLLIGVMAICATFLMFLRYDNGRNDWEFSSKMTTSDKKYSVVVEKNYSSLSSDNAVRLKLTCVDEITENEKEFGEYELSIPNGSNEEWYWLDEKDGVAEFVINNSYGEKRIALNWKDIFPDNT